MAGAQEAVGVDLRDAAGWARAAAGLGAGGEACALYHICPNVQPDEQVIGALALAAARGAGAHFVYHSVLHPQAEAMPHHWAKLRVEEMVFAAGVPFTILQPSAYMQNILGGWESIARDGVYRTPYPVTSRLSLVDLADVAEAAARVITEPGHAGATYELAGTLPLAQTEVAEALGRVLGRPVRAEETPLDAWEAGVRAAGMASFAVATLRQMFAYYARHGLAGNPNVLRWLLGREPQTVEGFLRGVARSEQRNVNCG
jgi:uncharacterized protein YbjT (DUF2867 family)